MVACFLNMRLLAALILPLFLQAQSKPAPATATPAPAPASKAPAKAPPMTAKSTAGAIKAADLFKQGISRRKKELKPIKSTFQKGDTQSSYVSYFDGKELVLIEEQLKSGPDGAAEQSTRSYYFVNDKLLLFEADKNLRDLSKKNAAPRKVTLRIAYDGYGRVVQKLKTENGQKATPTQAEVSEASAHAEALRLPRQK
jgi:hypothetical protein